MYQTLQDFVKGNIVKDVDSIDNRYYCGMDMLNGKDIPPHSLAYCSSKEGQAKKRAQDKKDSLSNERFSYPTRGNDFSPNF